ncbi:MAG: HNH endonuclease [Chlorobiaceae bacterium]|nr:HNH endonuclease [Chlorobiaceae bacterium]
MIRKPCRHPGCHSLTDRTDGYCLEHARQHRNEYAREYRKETGPRVYDTQRWRKLSKQILALHPFCPRCEAMGKVSLSTLVHHKDRDRNNWSSENLEALCKPCHEFEHRHEVFRRQPKQGAGGACEISSELKRQ